MAASSTNAPASANAQLSHHSLHSFSAHGLSLQHQTTQQQPGSAPEVMSSRPLYRGHASSSILPTSSQNFYKENLLRRKTPQGTLAAAYDATPVEWTTRPTKQILLPVLPSSGQHIHLDQGPRWQSAGAQGNQSWEGTLALRGADISLGSGCVNPTMWATNSGNQISTNDGLNPYVRDFLLQQDQMILPAADNMYTGVGPYGFQPLYNPITAPTASCEDIDGFMNSGHYNGVPRDSNFYGHYGAWGDSNIQLPQAPVYQMSSLYNPPIQQLDNASIWQPQVPSGGLMSVPTFPQDITPLYGLVPPPTGTPEAQFQHLQIDSPAHMIYQNGVISHSRDKALAWAHGVYVELLASIQAQSNDRAQSGDRTRGHNGSTKPGLYPRPPIQPRISGCKSNGFQPQPPVNGQHEGPSSDKGDMDRFKRTRFSPGREQHHPHIGTSSSHSQSLFCGNDGYPFSHNGGVAIYGGGNDVGGVSGNSESWNGGDQHPAKKRPVDCYFTSSLHHPSSGIENYGSFPSNIPYSSLGYMIDQRSSPTQAATVALEMLNGFCADSGWTWLDGMLLGGCLAYVRTIPSYSQLRKY